MPLRTVDGHNLNSIAYTARNLWYDETYDGNTAMCTWTVGATATFRFRGTSIRVVGGVTNEYPGWSYRASVSLDDGSPSYISETSGTASRWGVNFYSASSLRNTDHVLVIKYLSPHTNGFELCIDYIEYYDADSDPAPVISSTTTTTLPSPTVPPPSAPSTTVDTGNNSSPQHDGEGDKTDDDVEDKGETGQPNEPGDSTNAPAGGSPPISTTTASGTRVQSATKTVAHVTTTDEEGSVLVVTQTQFLRGGLTYTTNPAVEATQAPGDASGAAGASADSDSGKVPVGGLVGGILGVLVLVTVILGIILFRRHARRKKWEREFGYDDEYPFHPRSGKDHGAASQATVTPFVESESNTHNDNDRHFPAAYNFGTGTTTVNHKFPAPGDQQHFYQDTASPSLPGAATTTTATTTTNFSTVSGAYGGMAPSTVAGASEDSNEPWAAPTQRQWASTQPDTGRTNTGSLSYASEPLPTYTPTAAAATSPEEGPVNGSAQAWRDSGSPRWPQDAKS